LFGNPPLGHALLAARGCTRIEWTTDTGNLAAQRFYESLGARPLPTKLFYRVPLPEEQ